MWQFPNTVIQLHLLSSILSVITSAFRHNPMLKLWYPALLGLSASSFFFYLMSQTKQFPEIIVLECVPCSRIKGPNQLTPTSLARFSAAASCPVDFSNIHHISDFIISSVTLLKCSPGEDTLGQRFFSRVCIQIYPSMVVASLGCVSESQGEILNSTVHQP